MFIYLLRHVSAVLPYLCVHLFTATCFGSPSIFVCSFIYWDMFRQSFHICVFIYLLRHVSAVLPYLCVHLFTATCFGSPSGRSMTVGLTESLTEMGDQEYFPGGKCGRCKGLTTLAPSCADSLEIWQPQPPETLRGCPGLYRYSFTFTTANIRQFYN